MSRIICDFNDEWLFAKLPENVDICAVPEWEKVTLPHTWNAIDGVSGEPYYRGLTCYRKTFDCPYDGKRVFVEFGAANTIAEVYVNEVFVGKHEGGYSAFRFDITDYVKSTDNSIVVYVNNAPTDYIAPIADQGDFTKMGGLYRGARLIVTENVHIDMLDYGSSGIYVTPRNITWHDADIDILVKIVNDDINPSILSMKAEIIDEKDEVVAIDDKLFFIRGKDNSKLNFSIKMDEPFLWKGKKKPYLYRARITLFNGRTILDEYTQNFGIRNYYFDSKRGFYLNGKHIDLHGVNYHQDSFEHGWAMTDEERERDYVMMLEMGCNSIRMAHYQHCQQEYDLCDRLGITVWTEIGIVNKMSPDNDSLAISKGFTENAKQQLRELIRQNYNHPSIIVWGISNELHQMSDEIFELYQELYELACKEDGTRAKTFADSQFHGRFLELPAEVVGYNRYFGWYKEAGPIEKIGEWLDSYHSKKEKRPICVSEYGGGGAISQHKDNIDWENEIDPWGKRHFENYQSLLHEEIWAQFSKRKYLWGKYVWCMFDFASNGRVEGDTKGQNDKGLVTRTRIPKDAYYFYKSVWNSEPMIHITEKRFAKRPSVIPQVKIYANAKDVELFVNGVSAGMVSGKKDNSTVFVWENIQLNAGAKNDIIAKAYFENGNILQDNVVWEGI